MKQNKVVIVVLVVIALLFVLGLSSGVFRSKSGNDDKLTMSKAENQNTGWMAWLDKAMKPMRHSLDSRRLAPRATCQTGDYTYQLNDEKACDIPIAVSSDGVDVENAEISVAGQNVSVVLAYSSNEKDSESTRGMGVSLNKFKTPLKMTDIGKLKPPKVQPSSPQPPLELTVSYFPGGKVEAPNKTKKVEGKVGLTVLERGGTLRLQCKGCNRQQKRAIEIKLQ
jgi:hypothetical protein